MPVIVEEPRIKIIGLVNETEAMKHLERIGRTCYKSEDKITEESHAKFLRGIIERGHEAMIEHVSVTIQFYTDRGVTHEMVRHRLASFAQSSTRYCNYSQDKFGNAIHVIKPFYFDPEEPTKEVTLWDDTTAQMNSFDVWFNAMQVANWAYRNLTQVFGRQPQEARTVLPQSTASDIYVTANLREWRHIFRLRALGDTGTPHPDMRSIMLKALYYMTAFYPIVFKDIFNKCVEKGLYDNGLLYGNRPR